MGEVGSSQVDACAGVRTFGSKRRPTQVGMGETGVLQLEHPLPLECGVFEVAVRQVRPAQVELLLRFAKRGMAAGNRPALVAGRALPEHLQGARRGRRRRRRRRHGPVGAGAAQKCEEDAQHAETELLGAPGLRLALALGSGAGATVESDASGARFDRLISDRARATESYRAEGQG